MAAAAVWALVAAHADVHLKDNDGNTALHWAAMFSGSVEGAAAAAAAVIAAGSDPSALNNQGKTAAALVLQHKNVAQCAKLLEALLGQSAGARRSSGEVQRSSRSAAVLSAASRHGMDDFVSSSSAPPLQDTGATPCPVCLEPGACFTGPCGHLVCEGCAQTALVCWAGRWSSLFACGAKLFACERTLHEQASSISVGTGCPIRWQLRGGTSQFCHPASSV